MRFLDPKTLAAVRDLSLVAEAVVEGFLHGQHGSSRFGVGQEFSQYRSYEPGDDLRRVDWKLYARSDRFYVREAEVETSTRVRLVLDASASMQHTEDGVAKFDYARTLAASLAYLADRQGDAVGLHLLCGEGAASLPARRGGAHLRRVWHALEEAEPTGAWPRWGAVEGVLAEARREVVVFITDFHEQSDEIRAALAHLRALRNEVVLFHLLGRRERTLSYEGALEMEDLETGRTVQVDPRRVRAAYQEKMERHLTTLRRNVQDAGAAYALFALDEPLDRALLTFLRQRQRRA